MDLFTFTFDTEGDKNLLNVESKEFSKSSLIYGHDGFGKVTEDLNEKQSDKKFTKKNENNENDEDDDEEEEIQDFGGLPPPSKDISHIIEKALKRCAASDFDLKNRNKKMKSKFCFGSLAGNNDDGRKQQKSLKRTTVSLLSVSDDIIDASLIQTKINEELKESKLNGIEKQHAIECLSKRKEKEVRKEERSKTKGKNWFNMPATEKTEEIENDLKILQMRSALDPKHFYKKNDLKVLPKYFQIGTVQHSPLEYYNERDTRRNKKHTIVDELMADAEFQKYTKRKYKEIMERNQRAGYNKAMKKMKKLKKKKK